MAEPTGPSSEEAASFTWGGQRARPRKKIERSPITGQTFLKPPGSGGTKWPQTSISVDISCCEDCNIYLLDVSHQVQISDCHNCRIVVGPCRGSVFLLDSTNCRVAVAAKQLRVRDCRDCSFHIFAPTDESAVVETSKNLTFGCWNVAYPQLGAQFAMARWSPGAKNFWQRIYDFSPAEGDAAPNWRALTPAEHGDARWCELQCSPEGLNGGSVTEAASASPAVQGCECPCAAADGTQYTAAWFDASAVQAEQIQLEPAAPPAKPAPAPATPAAESSYFSRAVNWLLWLFGGGGSKGAKPTAAAVGDQSTICIVQ